MLNQIYCFQAYQCKYFATRLAKKLRTLGVSRGNVVDDIRSKKFLVHRAPGKMAKNKVLMLHDNVIALYLLAIYPLEIR